MSMYDGRVDELPYAFLVSARDEDKVVGGEGEGG